MNEKSFFFRYCIEFEDVDSYGIAHHSKLINLLERARVHFFHDHGISLSTGDFQLVLANLNVQFKSPAKMMDQVLVELKLEKLSNFSLTWNYTILRDETTLLNASIKMASVDKNTRPCVFPEEIRMLLESIQNN